MFLSVYSANKHEIRINIGIYRYIRCEVEANMKDKELRARKNRFGDAISIELCYTVLNVADN